MFEALIPAEWSQGVLRMQPAEFWLLSAFLLAVTLGAFYAIFRFVHRARLIEDTPTSKIRSASQGYVELSGFAELMPGDPILAPLTGTRCTWYEFKVEEKREHYDSRGNRKTSWHTINSGTSDELFFLQDDTGQCVIDPEGAEVTPSANDVWYGDTPSWTFGRPEKRGGLFHSGRYRYTEKRIHPVDDLYAIGLFQSIGGGHDLPNTRKEVSELLGSWKRDKDGLLERFDSDGDGRIDMQEWDAARKVAVQEVKAQQRERAKGPATHLLGKPRNSRRPYILSVLPQELLARRFRRFAAAGLAVFLLAGAIVTWMVTVRLFAG